MKLGREIRNGKSIEALCLQELEKMNEEAQKATKMS